jgi:hypothetical protein
MINLSPSLVRGAKAERTREQQQQVDAVSAALHAVDTIPICETLVRRLQSLEAFHPGIRKLRATVERRIAHDHAVAKINAECSALRAWSHARKTQTGRQLEATLRTLEEQHPELFKEAAELRAQLADARMYDMRKTGMAVPTL